MWLMSTTNNNADEISRIAKAAKVKLSPRVDSKPGETGSVYARDAQRQRKINSSTRSRNACSVAKAQSVLARNEEPRLYWRQ